MNAEWSSTSNDCQKITEGAEMEPRDSRSNPKNPKRADARCQQFEETSPPRDS